VAQHSKTAKQDIAAAAYRLFLAKGYEATSYRDIADAVGRDRTIVQYHYPRKDPIVVSMLDRVIALIEEYIVRHSIVERLGVDYRVALAQLYFAFLLQPDIRQFTLDVLSSRAITRELSVIDADWNADFLGASVEQRREVVQSGILAIGGAYELIYHHVATGEPIEGRWLARQTVINSMVLRDAQTSAESSMQTIDDAAVDRAILEVREELLAPPDAGRPVST
jgi:AcrR family transcriptional regulator